MPHSQSLETQFLLACLHSELDPEFISKYLASDPDWHRTLGRSARLGLAPLVYDRLKKGKHSKLIPRSILEQAKALYYGHYIKNIELYQKLQQILLVFSQHHIPTIVLKGAVLAELIYSQIALRPMNDLDLLIPEKDLDKAEHLLKDLGYRPDESRHLKEWYRTHHHHLVPHLSPDQSLSVELHHHITPPNLPISIPTDDLWRHVQPVTISEMRCLSFTPEFFLLHLCLHLSLGNAFLGPLRTLRDIAETLRFNKEKMNWSKFLRLAHTYNVSKHLYYTLWLSKEIVQADVSSHILQELRTSFKVFLWEDRIFKYLITRAMIFDYSERPAFYTWSLQDSCADWLSLTNRITQLHNICKRVYKRYREFAYRHGKDRGKLGAQNLFFYYPVHLMKRAMGRVLHERKTYTKIPT